MIWKRVRWSYFFGKERNFYDKYINGKFLGQWSENVIKKIREQVERWSKVIFLILEQLNAGKIIRTIKCR